MPLFCNHGLEPSETISLKSNVFLRKLPWSRHFIITKGKNYDNHTFLSCKGQTKSQKFWEGKCIVPMVDPANEVHFLTDWTKYINMTMKRSWKVSGLRNKSCAGLKDRKWRTWDVPRRRSSSGRHLLYGLTHVRCHFLIHTTKLSLCYLIGMFIDPSRLSGALDWHLALFKDSNCLFHLYPLYSLIFWN